MDGAEKTSIFFNNLEIFNNKKISLENCTNAMNVALDEFGIPMVVTPQNMSSPELDELSAITYLSYFIKDGSPGYKATLKWIHQYLPDEEINNFSVSLKKFSLI